VDPISIAVTRASLAAVAQEIFTVFERTALLPLLYDVHDFGISVFDDRRNLIADAPGIPEFVGSLDFALSSIVERFGEDEPLQSDDVIITTHPFLTGNHPPDASMIVPAFDGAALIGYCGLKAHMGDLGSKDTNPMDSRTVFDEGLLLPPMKLYSGERLNRDLITVIEANSRLPRETVGNILAAAGALRLGARRLSELVQRFGFDVYRATVEQLIAEGEGEVRSAIETLPDGVYAAEDWLDDNGISPGRVPLRCTVTIRGSEIVIDTSGSAPQQDGAFNATLPMTMAACRLALKRLTTENRITSNGGEHRPLTVIAPQGSIFNATSPAATFQMALTAQRLGEMIHTALAPVSGGRIPAGSAGDAALITGMIARDSGAEMLLDGMAPIGYGATATADGMSALFHFPLAGLRLQSAESTEISAPLALLRSELCRDSGGPGRRRGGLGTRFEWLSLGHGSASVFAEKLTGQEAEGQDGGSPAPLHNLVAINPGSEREVIGTKQGGVPIAPGDIIVIQGGSGAGWGDPLDRDPEAVADDVRQGFVSHDAALASYGVVLDPDSCEVDAEATTALRAGRRNGG
jgi:N-methylhydantoinase B